MVITSPVPFGASSLTNSPLLPDGSDFPCKQRAGVYDAAGASNSWPIGSTQKLVFKGSAVHGGGSCQVSVTYDEKPTKDSVWKVIHSIEGGCPMKNIAGNNGDNANAVSPDTYPFTVPASLPTGTAVMAWTWFNKIGNREMYMNCAPISITGGSAKREEQEDFEARNTTQLVERDTAAFNALPNMFTANIGTDCKTVDSQDVKFPAPGNSLDMDGAAAPVPPTGDSCGKVVAGGSAPSSGSGSGSSASTSAAGPSVKPTASSPGIPGGVFATVAPSAAPAQSTAAPVAAPSPVVSVAPPASPPSSVAPVASVVAPAPAPIASAPSTGTSGGAGAQPAGSACTSEGMWNCIGGTSFQQCASGTWSVVMQVAAGTTCAAGQSAAINITAIGAKAKRAVRFSHEHIRRHTQRS